MNKSISNTAAKMMAIFIGLILVVCAVGFFLPDKTQASTDPKEEIRKQEQQIEKMQKTVKLKKQKIDLQEQLEQVDDQLEGKDQDQGEFNSDGEDDILRPVSLLFPTADAKEQPKKAVLSVKKTTPTPPVKRAISKIEKKGGSVEQNKWAVYIYNKCQYKPEEAVLTIEAESGYRKDVKNKNKNGTYDIGLAQFNSQYHLPFIKSQDFSDPYKQVDYFCNMWDTYIKRGVPLGKRWYAYNVINKRPGVRDRILFYYKDEKTITKKKDPKCLVK